MDSKNKKSVPIINANGNPIPKSRALLFGNNAAWHCILCGELSGDTTMNGGIAECQCGKRYQVLPKDENNPQGKSGGVRALPMTAKELAQQLSVIAKRGVVRRKVNTSFHLFGILYASEMDAIGVKPEKLVSMAKVKYTAATEIRKGKTLAGYVKVVRPL